MGNVTDEAAFQCNQFILKFSIDFKKR